MKYCACVLLTVSVDMHLLKNLYRSRINLKFLGGTMCNISKRCIKDWTDNNTVINLPSLCS